MREAIVLENLVKTVPLRVIRELWSSRSGRGRAIFVRARLT